MAGVSAGRFKLNTAALVTSLGAFDTAVAPYAAAELRGVHRVQQRLAKPPKARHHHKDSSSTDTAFEDSVDAAVLNPFHSSAVPPMTLAAYACHVANATGYGTEGLAVGLALMARYDRAAVAAAMTGTAAVAAATTDTAAALAFVGVTALTMHRLFAACMQLGMKTASDFFVKNVYVAPLVGMTLAELNALELELAVVLDFRCYATRAEVSELPRALADLAAASGASHVHSPPLLRSVHTLLGTHASSGVGCDADDGAISHADEDDDVILDFRRRRVGDDNGRRWNRSVH